LARVCGLALDGRVENEAPFPFYFNQEESPARARPALASAEDKEWTVFASERLRTSKKIEIVEEKIQRYNDICNARLIACTFEFASSI